MKNKNGLDDKQRRDILNRAPRWILGALLILIGILCFTNGDVFSRFLKWVSIYLFGVFFFVPSCACFAGGVFLLAAPKEKVKRKIPWLDVSVAILAFFCLAVLLSSGDEFASLRVSSFTEQYSNLMAQSAPDGYFVSLPDRIGRVGGGFFASLTVSLGNSIGLGLVGTRWIFGLLFAFFALVLLRHPALALSRTVSRIRQEQKRSKVGVPKVDRKEESDGRRPSYANSSASSDAFDDVIVPPVSTPSVSKVGDVGKKKAEAPSNIPPVFGTDSVESERKAARGEAVSDILVERVKKPEPKVESVDLSALGRESSSSFSMEVTPKKEVDEARAEPRKPSTSYFDPVPAPKAPAEEPVGYGSEAMAKPFVSTNPLSLQKPRVINGDGFTTLQTDEQIAEDRRRAEENQMARKSEGPSTTSYVLPKIEANSSKQVVEEPVDGTPKPIRKEIPSIPVVYTSSKKYVLPDEQLLMDYDNSAVLEQLKKKDLEIAYQLNSFLSAYNIKAQSEGFDIGAAVTCFHIHMEPGVKMNAIDNVIQNLSVELGGNNSVRFLPVIPGKRFSGIEVGNPVSMTVPFKECYAYLMQLDPKCHQKLLIPLGKDVFGNIRVTQLDKLPHLLVAGSTGSGKSVFVHSVIMAVLMRTYPNEVKFLLIDPKKVEFARYNDMPHLFCPIVTEAEQAEVALSKMVDEMERRFSLFMKTGVVNIADYNEYCKGRSSMEKLPLIVVVIDEFADLMSTSEGTALESVKRLAAKARAAGIHLIVATQRPSVSVINGDIKNNIPARIALMVSSYQDSRVILGENGAEQLVGKGDLLAKIPGIKETLRCQSSYISDAEMKGVLDYLRERAKPVYNPEFLSLDAVLAADNYSGSEGSKNLLERLRGDPAYEEAKKAVLQSGKPTTNYLTRAMGISWNRANDFLLAMDAEGVTKKLPNGRHAIDGVEGYDSSDE